jgi:hypothetical protein
MDHPVHGVAELDHAMPRKALLGVQQGGEHELEPRGIRRVDEERQRTALRVPVQHLRAVMDGGPGTQDPLERILVRTNQELCILHHEASLQHPSHGSDVRSACAAADRPYPIARFEPDA